jgi:hypothetical protein
MKWNVCFYSRIETKPKQKEFVWTILEQNGMFTFIQVKIGTKPKQKEFFVRISEQNGTSYFVPITSQKANSFALKKSKCWHY